jgi:Na+-transporting NADH:ubiquinone oxidoreductase subunit NqrC
VKDKLFMAAFLLILGCAWTTALVGVDKWTAPHIAKNKAVAMNKSVLAALAIDYEGKDVTEVFAAEVAEEKSGDVTFYRSSDGAVAFEISGQGSQDKMSGVMALESDLNTIRGIVIPKSNHKETPGLGERVLTTDNLAKFKGKKMLPKLKLVPSGSKGVSEHEVHAITGATLTCGALEKLLNAEVDSKLALLKEDGR